jgi:hypothetical protein
MQDRGAGRRGIPIQEIGPRVIERQGGGDTHTGYKVPWIRRGNPNRIGRQGAGNTQDIGR